jgi:hypothetical protein
MAFIFILAKNVAHDLFVIHRFLLLANTEKSTQQPLSGPSIGVLSDHNRSAVEIPDEDLTDAADAMAELATSHNFPIFLFLRVLQRLLDQSSSIHYSLNISHLPLEKRMWVPHIHDCTRCLKD